jgi:hypothetical protein
MRQWLSIYCGPMNGDWPVSTRIKTRLSRWQRSYVKRRYATLFEKASSILFKHDPIGISSEDNTDEYDPEVGTILPRLSRCHSHADTRKVVFEEFCKWFGAEIAGDETRYDATAAELWALWSTHGPNGTSEPAS